jgi:hypothetical protein
MKYPGLIQTVCNGHGGGNMTGSWLHKILVVLVFIFLVAACAGPSVKRTEVDETIDLSGKWNDTDSRLVAEEMIAWKGHGSSDTKQATVEKPQR